MLLESLDCEECRRNAGFYDVSGFRAEGGPDEWWLDDDPRSCKTPTTACVPSALGKFLEPVWSCMGLHLPPSSIGVIPACFGGVARVIEAIVYPFIALPTAFGT